MFPDAMSLFARVAVVELKLGAALLVTRDAKDIGLRVRLVVAVLQCSPKGEASPAEVNTPIRPLITAAPEDTTYWPGTAARRGSA